MCFSVAFACLFSATGIWANPDLSQEQERNLSLVKELTKTWVKAYKSGDTETLMSVYTDETVIYIADKPSMRGLEEIRAYFEPRMGVYKFKLLIEDEEYLFHDDVIIQFSLVWISGRNSDTNQPFSNAVRSTIIFRNTPESGWRIYRDMDQHTADTDRPIDS